MPKPTRNGNTGLDLLRSRRRTSLFRLIQRWRKQYYALRRRKMKQHHEKFRHMTVRSTSSWYRFLLIFQRSFHYFRTVTSAVFSFLSPVIFPILGLALICGCLWFFSNYTVGLAVGVGDDVIGYVADSKEYSRISDLVEKQVKNESLAQTGEELFLIEAFPSLHYAIIPKDNFTSEQELFTSLYTMASEYTRRSYGFFLDGELIATSKDRSVLDQVLKTVLDAYVMNPEEDNLEIINHLEIIRGEYSQAYDLGYGRILDLFKTGSNLKNYTVMKGDSLSSISQRSGISVPVLRLLNDIPVGQDVSVGQTILYGKPYHQLTVKNTLTVTSAETIPFETEYSYSSNYYEGTKKVLIAGSEGVYEVISHNVYVNGTPSSTTVMSKTKIKDPVPAKVLIGTKKIAPSGYFIFPLKSYQFISSPYGWRWLRGARNFHQGLDIAAAYGTPIFAADAGVVVEAGWSGSLGYCVKIDHGNGILTIYGHASSIDPSIYAGKKVYQGEMIAYVGSTGNSTGNHLHFAVYQPASRTYLDPQKYL